MVRVIRKLFRAFQDTMASIEAKLERLIGFALTERAALIKENAALKEQLAADNADDLTLEAAVAAAQEAAATAQANVDALQALADVDAAQDQKLSGLIATAEEAFGLEPEAASESTAEQLELL